MTGHWDADTEDLGCQGLFVSIAWHQVVVLGSVIWRFTPNNGESNGQEDGKLSGNWGYVGAYVSYCQYSPY